MDILFLAFTDVLFRPASVVSTQGPCGALKVLKSLEFGWTKFKALKSLNLIK